MIQIGDILILTNGMITGPVSGFDKKGTILIDNNLLMVYPERVRSYLRKNGDNVWIEYNLNIEKIKAKYKDKSLEEIKEAKFINDMVEPWEKFNYDFDTAMNELLKEKGE